MCELQVVTPTASGAVKNGKTLILDLDETLACSQINPEIEPLEIYTNPVIFRKFHPKGTSQICFSTTIFSIEAKAHLRIWGIMRPGLFEFLQFAQEYFENVIIWSAGLSAYVDAICKEIFNAPNLKLPRLIWARDQCANISTPGQLIFHKPIANLIHALQSAGSPITIKIEKTLILDDRPHTFIDNPDNGVLIPQFKPSRSIEDLTSRSDNHLYKFIRWLNTPEVQNSIDYRLLDKTGIFL